MNIILTGATGTLGSRILYELLNPQRREVDRVYLLVRGKNRRTPEERVRSVLSSRYAPPYLREDRSGMAHKVRVVPVKEMPEPSAFLEGNGPTFFIHAAGYVNLSVSASSRATVFKGNLAFTQQLFNAFHSYIDKFIYVSTAFSVGDVGGCLGNDYLSVRSADHRNHYEEAKYRTERFVVEAGGRYRVPVQILRPSVLGGNVIDQPDYFISKYMVFYLFAKFFYNTTSKDIVRITLREGATLNIIPTDYAAKVIASVFLTDIEQLNIVHRQGTNIMRGISNIFEAVGFRGYRLVDTAVDHEHDTTELERFYYQTIGVHLRPYLHSKPHTWDTSLLEQILPIPAYDPEDYIINTIEFAKARNFRNERW